jgi:hypothetical protein
MWEEVCWMETKSMVIEKERKKYFCEKGEAINTTNKTTQGISLCSVQ